MLPILDILFKKKGNLIVLEKPPDSNLIGYFGDLGLSLPEIWILPEDFYANFLSKEEKFSNILNKLKNHSAATIMGYVIDETLLKLAESVGKKVVGSMEGSLKGNNKRLLHHFLEEKGLPTFDTLEAKDPGQVPKCLSTLSKKGYRFAVIKSQIGASGIGMKKLEISKGLADPLPTYLFHEGPVLVQGWLNEHISDVKTISSPSILLYVEDDTFWFYDLTAQILSPNSIHEGNISPAPFLEEYPQAKDQLIEQAKEVGSWLKEQGYRGTASIDFLVIQRKGKLEARVCEINARVTGATYPSILAKHFLPHHTWLLRNIRFSDPLGSEEILGRLKKADLLFLKGKSYGVLPFNFNKNADGKIFKAQFLFLAETQAKVYTLIDDVREKISSPGDFDRD